MDNLYRIENIANLTEYGTRLVSDEDLAVLKTCRVFGVAAWELRSPSKKSYRCRARWALWACLDQLGLTASEISRRFDRDRTTVEHGIERCRELMKTDPAYAEQAALLGVR